MIRLALKMLFGDRGKHLLLVSGLMTWIYANLFNSRSHLWVMDPKAEESPDSEPLRDTDEFAVGEARLETA